MTVMNNHETTDLQRDVRDELEQGEQPEHTGEYRSPGSIRFGPFVISARFSIVLIFIIVIGFNLLLFLGVILAALYRSGRL
jgi:hypothetical protein